jgi:hypothetical protein
MTKLLRKSANILSMHLRENDVRIRTFLCCVALLVTKGATLLAPSNVTRGSTMRGVIHMEVPEYPIVPRGALLQASVQLRVQVSKDGKVVSADVNSISGNLEKSRMLGGYAVENVKTWIFADAQKDTIEDILYEYKLISRRVFHPCSYVVLDSPHHIVIRSEMPEIESSRSSN